jgi:hypothetical protein
VEEALLGAAGAVAASMSVAATARMTATATTDGVAAVDRERLVATAQDPARARAAMNRGVVAVVTPVLGARMLVRRIEAAIGTASAVARTTTMRSVAAAAPRGRPVAIAQNLTVMIRGLVGTELRPRSRRRMTEVATRIVIVLVTGIATALVTGIVMVAVIATVIEAVLEGAKVEVDVELGEIRKGTERAVAEETEADARDPATVSLASAEVGTRALAGTAAALETDTSGGVRPQQCAGKWRSFLPSRLLITSLDINRSTRTNDKSNT